MAEEPEDDYPILSGDALDEIWDIAARNSGWDGIQGMFVGRLRPDLQAKLQQREKGEPPAASATDDPGI